MKKSEYLQMRMREKGINMSQLAKDSGVPYTTIRSMLERDLKKAAIENVIAICNVIGISIDELTRIEKGLPQNVEMADSDIIKIPIIGTIACGDPITADENITGYIKESKTNLPSGNLFALRVKGDSMEPTIPDGSVVTIREQSTFENGEIVAVLVNGDTEATLKRIKFQGELLILVPDNNHYQPMVVTEENSVRIIGKAVRFSQNL